MSKVLLVNGSSRQEGNTSVALAEVAVALEGHGIETETMWLGSKPVNDCIACGKCIQSGCPSVVLSDAVHPKTGKRKARIEPVTCVGCGVCSQICPVQAISGPENA